MSGELLRELRILLKGRDETHGVGHAERVALFTRLFASDWPELGEKDRENAVILAYAHDIDDPKYAEEGTGADSFLQKHLREMDTNRAKEIITRASWSDEQRQLETTGRRDWEDLKWTKQELAMRHCLSDADKLEAINENGLERCALYVCSKFPNARLDFVYEKVHKHAAEKLLRIRDHLHTPMAVKLGWRYHGDLEAALPSFKSTIKLDELPLVAPALNIEGGLPSLHLRSPALWFNLVVVLDTPLSGLTFDGVLKMKREWKFPCLESALDTINECHLLSVYLHIMTSCLEKIQKWRAEQKSLPLPLPLPEVEVEVKVEAEGEVSTESDKDKGKQGKKRKAFSEDCADGLPVIGVHLHFFPEDAKFWIAVLRAALENLSLVDKAEWVFSHDTPTYTTTTCNYSQFDALVSLSQCAGLQRGQKPGQLLVTDRFIPWSLQTNLINIKAAYTARNQLVFKQVQDDCFRRNGATEEILKYVNSAYKQSNPKKSSHKATREDLGDLTRISGMLQVSGIWNPPTDPAAYKKAKVKLKHFQHRDHEPWFQ